MPEDLKLYEWLFDKGLAVGLVIYFVFWFTQKIDPKLTLLIDGITKLIEREEGRGEAFETVVKAKTQTAETVARIETDLRRVEGTIQAILTHVQKQ